MYSATDKCRVCGEVNLLSVLSLGQQSLTGVFPKKENVHITSGPLDLVWCQDCGLLQLKQSYSLSEMYGENYGYRSGLNMSMVRHLQQKIHTLEKMFPLQENDIVLDIGSNDATSLKAYQSRCRKIGMDPTGLKFKQYYTDDIVLVPDFFSAGSFRDAFPCGKAKIVTSIAMFYDLEEPLRFIRDIECILAPDGVWHFEQSYMPSMLRTNAYDTICHEHVEFYSFRVVRDMLAQCGMQVLDVQTNAVNGGSFAVTACKLGATYSPNVPVINWLLQQEDDMGLTTPKPYRDFEERVFRHRKNLKELVESLVAAGKTVAGYGASTKGNVLLQFCGLDRRHIKCIAEVNEDKFGAFTPGTNIPIVSEAEVRAMKPDYLLVLPWHFKHFILEREKEFIEQGGKFIFPLPEIEIV